MFKGCVRLGGYVVYDVLVHPLCALSENPQIMKQGRLAYAQRQIAPPCATMNEATGE